MCPVVNLDSRFGKTIGFTSDKFVKYSYLWKMRKTIYISLIESVKPGEGDFGRLLVNLQRLGFRVKVPTPSSRMTLILLRKGFKPTREVAHGEQCEVWVKEAA